MDHFGAINAFMQTAATGSFTHAGRKLGLSSSAVGKAVSRLEESLGIGLLHRSTRAMTLTPEGLLFLERCRAIVNDLESAQREMTEIAGKPRGQLRVGLPQLGQHLMVSITAFQLAHPDIELDLDISDRLVDIIGEGFDAVIRIGSLDDSRLRGRMLGSYRHRLVASPAYLKTRPAPRSIMDLKGHVCLHYRYPTSGKIDPWPFAARHLPARDIPRSAAANSIDALQDMALAGLGIACLPDFCVEAPIEAGLLSPVLEGYLDDSRHLHVVWPASRQPLPRIKAFVEFMVGRAETGALWRRVSL